MQMQSRAIEIGLAIEAEWARCMGEVEMGALRALFKVLAESIPETNGAGDLPAQSPLTNTSTKKRSEEHTSELQSLMRISYAVFCLKTKIHTKKKRANTNIH